MNREDDIQVLQEARPFIRSVVALIIYLRRDTMEDCYQYADFFLDQLEKDLRGR